MLTVTVGTGFGSPGVALPAAEPKVAPTAPVAPARPAAPYASHGVRFRAVHAGPAVDMTGEGLAIGAVGAGISSGAKCAVHADPSQ